MIALVPGQVGLTQLEQVWRGEGRISLHHDARAPVEAAQALVGKTARGKDAIYGINTGFGKLAHMAAVMFGAGEAVKDGSVMTGNYALKEVAGFEPVAFAADQIALAVAEIGSIAQRRVALMVDPSPSFDVPPFLPPEPGLHSGFRIANGRIVRGLDLQPYIPGLV